MLKLIIPFFAGIIGIVAGVNMVDTPPPAPLIVNSQPDENYNQQIQQLKLELQNLATTLQNESQLRAENQKEIQNLQQQLAKVSQQPLIPEPVVTSALESPTPELPNDSNHQAGLTSTSTNANRTNSENQVLVSIGVDPVIADSIKQRSEKRELDMLYLRNKATREGWFGTEKYFKESQELEQSSNIYREELGDNKYDEYLYASGRFNRIKVSSVLTASPAQEAGIRADDVIIAYDNKRVFNWNDLTSLTAAGNPGDMVEVTVSRNDGPLKLVMPRGPMGVRLDMLRQDPQEG